MALCLALALSPALAETYVQPGVFSITGPDGWSVADSLLMNESAPCVSIEMGYYPEQADFNLFSADADAFQDYANRLLVRYADRSGQYLGVVYSTDSSIPFILIGASDASASAGDRASAKHSATAQIPPFFICKHLRRSSWQYYMAFGYP